MQPSTEPLSAVRPAPRTQRGSGSLPRPVNRTTTLRTVAFLPISLDLSRADRHPAHRRDRRFLHRRCSGPNHEREPTMTTDWLAGQRPRRTFRILNETSPVAVSSGCSRRSIAMSYVDRIVRWREGTEWRDGSGMPCERGDYPEVRYDLSRMSREVDRDALARGPSSLWRYADLLPVDKPEHAVTLGEGWTPLLPMRQASRRRAGVPPALGQGRGAQPVRNIQGPRRIRRGDEAARAWCFHGRSQQLRQCRGRVGALLGPRRSALRQPAADRRDGGKPAAEHVERSRHRAVRGALAGSGRCGGEGRWRRTAGSTQAR